MREVAVEAAIEVRGVRRAALAATLQERGYLQLDGGYDYLTKGITVDRLTAEEIELLERRMREAVDALDALRRTAPEDMWRAELDQLEAIIQ